LIGSTDHLVTHYVIFSISLLPRPSCSQISRSAPFSQIPSACVPFSVYKGIWGSVARLVIPDVSKEPNAFIFKIWGVQKDYSSLENKAQRRGPTNSKPRRHMLEGMNYKSQSSIIFYT
jgi:hypothetical protein